MTEGWRPLVGRMKVARVVVRADISAGELEVLLDWLVAEFGPDSNPLPRTCVPRDLAESEYLADAEAARLLTEACTSCHGRDRVDAARLSDEEWRAMLVGKIGTGAPRSRCQGSSRWSSGSRERAESTRRTETCSDFIVGLASPA